MAIASIENQSFADFEFIVVANQLADADFLALQLRCVDRRIRLFRTDVRGLSFSLNLGLHHCRASLVARMDADDIAYPHRLASQMAFMATNSDVVLCSSAYEIINEKNEVIGKRVLLENNEAIRSSLWFSNPICHPAVIYRREPVIQQGGYSGNGGAEDYDLWLRLSENQQNIFANIPEPLIAYRTPITSIARRSRRAYLHVATCQLDAFFRLGKLKYLIGSILFLVKAILRASKA